MKKRCHLIILLFVSFCKFSTAQILCIYCYDQNARMSLGVTNLLLNGSFENTTCIPNPPNSTFCPNSTYAPFCTISNWTASGGGTSTYADIIDTNTVNSRSIVVQGTKAVYFGNYYSKSCSPLTGDTSCLNNIGCTVTGVPAGYPVNTFNYGGTTGVSLEQTVTGLATGNAYVLEFWAGGEQFCPDRGLFAVDVGFGDTLMRNKPTFQAGLNGPHIGTRFIIEFKATSSSHTIKFTNWGHMCGNCTELVIDDARLYTLAELDVSVPHCTVGIDILSASVVLENLASPNPFTNELNVKTNNNELSEIIIYDITSRKILKQSFTNSTSINTEQLAKGIYLYELRNKNGVIKKGKAVKD